jgi:hypothetical protein
MGRMVNVEIAGEDLVRLAAGLSAWGDDALEPALVWLLREGANHFALDQRRWEQLRTNSDTVQPALLELQRREVAAHVFSMRARTLRTELERDALQAEVDALGQEYEALRRRLVQLQWECRRLRMAVGDGG